MDYIIVEDEPLSAERLAKMVHTIRPTNRLMATLDSVASTLAWLRKNPHPKLALFDIQLADGLSFELFEQANIDFPVIFTTAYNEYALKAFKVNSIDYLLKPIDEKELATALAKFDNRNQPPLTLDREQLSGLLKLLENNYKSRFLVKVGEHLKMIGCQEIAFFYSLEKCTFIRSSEGRDYPLDQTLDQVQLMVDPKLFFRINRSCLLSIHAIRDIIAYSNSRLKITPTIKHDQDMVVSRERVAGFKKWLEQ